MTRVRFAAGPSADVSLAVKFPRAHSEPPAEGFGISRVYVDSTYRFTGANQEDGTKTKGDDGLAASKISGVLKTRP